MSHTSFPLLGFFRSSHPANHWVLAAEAVLDGASLVDTTCDVPRQSRSELCIEAGVGALSVLADFLGIAREPPADEPSLRLARETFDAGCDSLEAYGVPVLDDRDRAWEDFRRSRNLSQLHLTCGDLFSERQHQETVRCQAQPPKNSLRQSSTASRPERTC